MLEQPCLTKWHELKHKDPIISVRIVKERQKRAEKLTSVRQI